MKPGFALSLSAEGIVLLHRAAGGWRNVGRVPLDATDLPADLVVLRRRGDAIEPDGNCKLIIPNDQIRYLTIDTGAADLATQQEMARAALEGATPYTVDELTFDLSQDGNRTHVAAVAQETLAEAESFALDNGFKPVSFVAAPGEMDFLGEPFFGTTSAIGATQVEPDGIAVVDIGPAQVPAPAAAQKAVTSIPKAPAAAPVQSATPSIDEESTVSEDDGPVAGFSSRRRKSSVSAQTATPPATTASKTPALAGANRGSPPPPSRIAPSVPEQSTVTSNQGAATPVSSVVPDARTKDQTALRADVQTADIQPAASDGQAGPNPAPLPPTAPHTPAAVEGPVKTAPPTASAVASSTRPNGSNAAKQAKTLTKGKGKGKPRYLGLILTVALLLVMAAVAALALLSDSSIFTSAPPVQQHSPDADTQPDASPPVGQNVQPQAPDIVTPGQVLPEDDTDPNSQDAPLPVSIAPQVSALPGQPDPGIIELENPDQSPATLTLNTETQASTDQAVLDALQGDETSATGTAASQNNEPLAEGTVSTPGEFTQTLDQAALYAATGIWHQVPKIAETPALISLDDIYIASIDNSNLSQDAVALPEASTLPTDPVPDAVTSPAAPGRAFILDSRGLVAATREGTLNPDGVIVYLGRPENTPPPTPDRSNLATVVAQAEAENARLELLSRKRPRPRPTDLVEQAERALLGGLSLAELAKVRPRSRPESLKTIEQESGPVSALATATSVAPRARPTNFANLVDRARRNSNNAAAASTTASAAAVPTIAPQTVTPSLPSSASVARQATVNNAINLRRVNLIGVFGTPADRRALIRMPSGRYKKVQVGDRIDGGTVVAIGDSQLQYQKRGTNTTLKLPGN